MKREYITFTGKDQVSRKAKGPFEKLAAKLWKRNLDAMVTLHHKKNDEFCIAVYGSNYCEVAYISLAGVIDQLTENDWGISDFENAAVQLDKCAELMRATKILRAYPYANEFRKKHGLPPLTSDQEDTDLHNRIDVLDESGMHRLDAIKQACSEAREAIAKAKEA